MSAARLRGTEFVGKVGGALVGTLVMVVAAALRSSQSEPPRKPPGTI